MFRALLLTMNVNKALHIKVPGLRHVNMLTSSAKTSCVNVRVTVSPEVPGGGLWLKNIFFTPYEKIYL